MSENEIIYNWNMGWRRVAVRIGPRIGGGASGKKYPGEECSTGHNIHVMTGQFETVRINDIGLEITMPPGTLSATSREETAREALTYMTENLEAMELLDLFRMLGDLNKRLGIRTAQEALKNTTSVLDLVRTAV
jgi:hypothetical protein